MGVVAMMARVATARFDKQTDSEVGTRFHARLIEVNALRHRQRQLQDLRERVARAIARGLRTQYERLLSDLRGALARQQREAVGAKRKVYDDVLTKINRAKAVALTLRSPAELEAVGDAGPRLDQDFLARIRTANGEMRREITVGRVLRCMNAVAVRRHFSKTIGEVDGERRTANAALWADRLRCGAIHAATGQRIWDAHQQLSVTQAEIVRLKTQLENVKLGNIQLVHWKANNLKVIDGLQRRRAEYAGTGDMDIDALIARLEPAQAQLEELDAFKCEFDGKVERDVRAPIRTIGGMRAGIAGVRKGGAAAAAEARMADVALWETEARVGKWTQARLENEALGAKNAELREKIAELEEEKRGRAVAVRKFMEDVIRTKAPSLRARTRFARKITRPVVPARAASRI
jgi:hypothetical protein